MSKNEIFIEKHDNGYAVLKPNAERASAVCPTQAQAIERAAEIAPTAEILVERVRHTEAGHPDKWRKA